MTYPDIAEFVVNPQSAENGHGESYGRFRQMNKFKCDGCGVVEHGIPKHLCLLCNLEFAQIRNLVREMSRRLKFDYSDVHLGLKRGINILVDKINGRQTPK